MSNTLTDIYSRTSAVATTEADIRLAGSTEYSARTFLIPFICYYSGDQTKWLPVGYNISNEYTELKWKFTNDCKFWNLLMDNKFFGRSVLGQGATISACFLYGNAWKSLYVLMTLMKVRVKQYCVIVIGSQGFRTCHNSSVTKGMNGCNSFSIFSNTYKRTICVIRVAEPSPEWLRRVLLDSIYLNNNTFLKIYKYTRKHAP